MLVMLLLALYWAEYFDVVGCWGSCDDDSTATRTIYIKIYKWIEYIWFSLSHFEWARIIKRMMITKRTDNTTPATTLKCHTKELQWKTHVFGSIFARNKQFIFSHKLDLYKENGTGSLSRSRQHFNTVNPLSSIQVLFKLITVDSFLQSNDDASKAHCENFAFHWKNCSLNLCVQMNKRETHSNYFWHFIDSI